MPPIQVHLLGINGQLDLSLMLLASGAIRHPLERVLMLLQVWSLMRVPAPLLMERLVILLLFLVIKPYRITELGEDLIMLENATSSTKKRESII